MKMNDNNLIHENEVLRHELALLRDWKKSVIAIESEWDEQAIAKMLGAKLGQPCRKVIAREVPKLVADNAALRADKERLDWMETNSREYNYGPSWRIAWEFGQDASLRAVIDAARKGDQP